MTATHPHTAVPIFSRNAPTCHECRRPIPDGAPVVMVEVVESIGLYRTRGLRGFCEACSRTSPEYLDTHPCEGCGRPVRMVLLGRPPRGRVWCSGACEWGWRNRERRRRQLDARPTRRCAGCGSDLPRERRTDARYCTPACRQRAYRRRQAHHEGGSDAG